MLLWTVPYMVQSFAVIQNEGKLVMRSYKALTLLSAAVILAGCAERAKSDKNEAYETAAESTTAVTAADTTTEAASTAVTEPATKNDYPVKFDHEITDGVLKLNNRTYGEFRIDIGEAANVTVEDYNFDGYDDVYCKNEGYWLFNSEKPDFVKSDKFPKYWDMFLKLEIADRSEKTLIGEYSGTESGKIIYQWQGDELVPISMEQEIPFDKTRCSYIFDSDGNMIMTKREIYDLSNGEVISTDEKPDYFRYTDHSIDHMSGSDIIQIIDIDMTPEEVQSEPKNYYNKMDYNSDGYSDLHCEIRCKEYIRRLHFIYDPYSGMYIRDDFLTDLDVNEIYVQDKGEFAGTLTCRKSGSTERIVYRVKWEDGKCKPFRKELSFKYVREDGSLCCTHEIYEYDDEGNEVLTEHEEEDTKFETFGEWWPRD